MILQNNCRLLHEEESDDDDQKKMKKKIKLTRKQETILTNLIAAM